MKQAPMQIWASQILQVERDGGFWLAEPFRVIEFCDVDEKGFT